MFYSWKCICGNKLYLLGLEMSTGVHGQTASTTAESVALGSVLTGVAVFAEQFLLVLCAVCGVQWFVAHTYKKIEFSTFKKCSIYLLHNKIIITSKTLCCTLMQHNGIICWNVWSFANAIELTTLETCLVIFVSTSNTFFSGIHWLVALGALWVFYWFERHFEWCSFVLLKSA